MVEPALIVPDIPFVDAQVSTGVEGTLEHPAAVILFDCRHCDSPVDCAIAYNISPEAIDRPLMFHVEPVLALTVPALIPFLYNVIVAVDGFDASSLDQVPLTVTLPPAVIGDDKTGAWVQVAPTVVNVFKLIAGWALTTVCHAAAVLEYCESSIP